jgi:hypothetical protein
MAIRQSWRFEKDIFGKKHRKYFLENIFGADVADMQTFRALRTKLSKDYLGFFNGLDKSYERGEHKKMAQKSVEITLATISVLDTMINSGIINAETVGITADNVDNLNASRDFFVAQAEQVKALKARMDKIEAETGISAQGLNIAREMVTTGAKRERKRQREGVASFLGRTAPRTAALGGELARATGVAALGPAFPLAQVAGGALADIFGVGKGLVQKFGERREKKLGARLRPLAHDLPGATVRGVAQARGLGAVLPKVEQQRRKTGAATLTDFFNKGAYKAKWTKNLLKEMKQANKRRKNGLFGLGGIFGRLRTSILPLLGKAGLLAALGAATVVSTVKIGQLTNKIIDFVGVQGKITKSLEKQYGLQEKFTNKLAVVLSEKVKVAEKGTKELSEVNTLIRSRMEIRSRALQLAPSKIQDPFVQLDDIENRFNRGGPGIQRIPDRLASPGGSVLASQVEKLATSIEILSQKMEKQARGQERPMIKESGVGNPYDNSDDVLKGYSGGNIELRQE